VEAGLGLLPAQAEDASYDLVFGLRLLRAQALVVLGRVNEAEAEFADLLPWARPGFDRAHACDVRSEAFHSIGRTAEGYAASREGLEHLGVQFPATPEESAALLSRLLDPSVVARFEHLPEGDAEAQLMGRLFWRATIGAYSSHPADLPIVIAKHVEEAPRRGLTPHIAPALGFAAMVVLMQGHIERAMAYGEAALSVSEQLDDPALRGRGEAVAWIMTVGWSRPFAESEQAFGEFGSRCFAAGDLEFVSYAGLGAYIASLVAGRDCSAILKRCEEWLDVCVKFFPFEEGQARIRRAALQRLMALDVDVVDAEALMAEYTEQGDLTDVCESLAELARIEMLFGDYDAAYVYATRAEPPIEAGAAGTLLFNYVYWATYAIAAARIGELSKADSLLAKMRPFAEFNPDNFRSYYTLVEAERARAAGDSDGAVRGYLRTIEHAGRQGYVLLEACANELLARHYQERGHRFAVAHF
jgi:tetratricopeptide (TPR) repeat protein